MNTPAETAIAPGPTCSGCRHWHCLEQQKAAVQTNKGRAVLIEQKKPPAKGECRGMPPQLVVVPAQGGAAILSQYPQTVEFTPSCGVFAEKMPRTVGPDLNGQHEAA